MDHPDLHVVIDARVVSLAPAARRALAQKRSLAVKAWLTAHGVDGTRLVVQPIQGGKHPPEEPATDRVELHIIEQTETKGPPLD